MHFTSLTRGICTIDVARYYTANSAQNVNLGAVRPVSAAPDHGLVHPSLEKHDVTSGLLRAPAVIGLPVYPDRLNISTVVS